MCLFPSRGAGCSGRESHHLHGSAACMQFLEDCFAQVFPCVQELRATALICDLRCVFSLLSLVFFCRMGDVEEQHIPVNIVFELHEKDSECIVRLYISMYFRYLRTISGICVNPNFGEHFWSVVSEHLSHWWSQIKSFSYLARKQWLLLGLSFVRSV